MNFKLQSKIGTFDLVSNYLAVKVCSFITIFQEELN